MEMIVGSECFMVLGLESTVSGEHDDEVDREQGEDPARYTSL